MLCSDGLTIAMDDSEIQSAIVNAPDPETASAGLIQTANERGAQDNITVVIVQLRLVPER